MRFAVAVLILFTLVGCASRAVPTPVPTRPAAAEMVTYRPTTDARGWLCRPVGAGPFPAIVVIHGDFGLTDWVKDQAQHQADRGFVALAVDLYHGEKPHDLMDAHILDRGLPEERVFGDLRAAVDYLSQRPDVRAERLGILGWDMGGGYALDAAIRDPRLGAVVTCYGRLRTEAAGLAPLRASVLGIFAGKDEGIPPQTIEQFRASMKKAGKRLAGVEVYPECEHGFMDSTAPDSAGTYNSSATADAWKRIDAYLAAELCR